MMELIKKGFYTSLGLLLLSKEKAEELARELVKRGELSEKEGREFAEEVVKKSKEAQKEFFQKVEGIVTEVLGKLDIPTRKELSALEDKIAQLEERLKTKGGEE